MWDSFLDLCALGVCSVNQTSPLPFHLFLLALFWQVNRQGVSWWTSSCRIASTMQTASKSIKYFELVLVSYRPTLSGGQGSHMVLPPNLVLGCSPRYLISTPKPCWVLTKRWNGRSCPFRSKTHDSCSKAPLVIFMWQCDPTEDGCMN